MEELVSEIRQWILARTIKWDSLIDEDNEAISDEDALLHEAIDDLSDWMAERLQNHPVIINVLEEARLEVRELAAENAAYNRAMNGTVEDQLRWHGLTVKDFI